ncbi:hypothetical protein BOO86_03350 [Mycobacterium sp. CBMA 234]|nr:hypothetical protein [Mycolicibacterium sp. CBMA 234]
MPCPAGAGPSTSHTEVAIVGAGPVGLFLARELALAGISVVVLEKSASRNPHSKATSIQARTIELLIMRGIAQQFLDAGITKPSYHFGGLTRLINLGGVDSPFPATLVLPQSRTEEFLEAAAIAAGARVLRDREVTGLTQDADGVTVRASDRTGASEMVRAAYVVGADGARSVVRKLGGFEFEGFAADTFGYLLDAPLRNPPSTNYIHNAQGYLMILPLSHSLYRLVGIDSDPHAPERIPRSEAAIRESIARIAGTDLQIGKTAWISHFGNTTRQATQYRNDRIFLVGDAAHIHFPTGGVGLNLGLQDAANLGWKLGYALRGHISADDLDSYHAERHPVGATVLESSLSQTALMTAFSPQGLALRNWLCQHIETNPQLEQTLAEYISGAGIAYPRSSETDHPLVGRRVPDLALIIDGRPTSLYSLFDQPVHVGIEFDPGAMTSVPLGQLPVRIHTAEKIASSEEPWAATRALLIRPDGYLAWAT